MCGWSEIQDTAIVDGIKVVVCREMTRHERLSYDLGLDLGLGLGLPLLFFVLWFLYPCIISLFTPRRAPEGLPS